MKMDVLDYEILALSGQNKDPFQRFFRRKRFDVVINSVTTLKIKKKIIKVLELGCGAGAVSLELARRGYDVTAVDMNKRFIEHGKNEAKKEGLKNVTFLQKDITKPLNLVEYDIVLTSEVIEHIRDFRSVFRNIEKHLSHGGYLVLTVPNHAGIGDLTEFLWSLKARYGWVDEHYGYCCSTKRIEKLLREFGIEPLKTSTVFYISHFLPFISEWLAQLVFEKEVKYLSRIRFGTIIVNISRRML